MILDYEIIKYKLINPNIEFKICSKCKRNLPANNIYYEKQSSTKSGIRSACKECRDKSFDILYPNKVLKEFIPKGYQFCTKCKKLLPLNLEYFSKDNRNGNKFIPVCKECSGKSYGIHFINAIKDFKVKGTKICIKCLRRLPENFIYFYKRSQNAFESICKECQGYNFGVSFPNRIHSFDIPNGYRICKSCWSILPSSNKYFSINNNLKDGLNFICKNCVNILSQIRRQNKNIDNMLTINDWIKTLEEFNYSCAYCGMSQTEHQIKYNELLNQEHIIPFSKDGLYTKNNIIPSCRHCNDSKNAKSLNDFYIYCQNKYENNNPFTYERYLFILDFVKRHTVN